MADEQEYRMFLCGVPGLFYFDQMRLLEAFGSYKAIYEADELMLRMNIDGKQNLIDSLIRLREERDPFREYDDMMRKGIGFASLDDPLYPQRLRDIPEPPMGLFYIGEMPHDDHPSVAVIGSRACSNYGKEMSLRFSKDLAKAGIDIVSGMAVGVDGYSHRGSLNAGGLSTAVLGSGPDVCYPQANRDVYERMKEQGCILSEYYPGTPPLHLNFPRRNRIIAGLSDVILVVEAKQKSGTLITVDQGLEQGKDIFAIPGKLTDTMSAGCNELIRNGASIALSAANIIEEIAPKYGLTIKTGHIITAELPVPKEHSGEKNLFQKVYGELSYDPVTPEEIADKTGVDLREVLSVLTMMEMEGRCGRIGMSSYVKTDYKT